MLFGACKEVLLGFHLNRVEAKGFSSDIQSRCRNNFVHLMLLLDDLVVWLHAFLLLHYFRNCKIRLKPSVEASNQCNNTPIDWQTIIREPFSNAVSLFHCINSLNVLLSVWYIFLYHIHMLKHPFFYFILFFQLWSTYNYAADGTRGTHLNKKRKPAEKVLSSQADNVK